MVPQRRNGAFPNARLALSISTLLIGLLMACSQRSLPTQSSQTDYQAAIDEEVFTVVEVPPGFPGGNAGLSSYLRENLRYPEAAIKAKVQGKVFVSFLVTKEGTIRNVAILKGFGYGINEEAIRLIQAMPNWIPGRQSGHPVNVKYNLVVPFDY
ncbi:energy transducer TonB [Spirosoma fluviale]|uniref:TonB family C-terminal domain-containing protein n=1 Tax=Spirosoma fluviale TaxID=1597977 RepID=A0A286GNL9_9BACT|nr:energy transducer TonB [Spirosoma fluviale]SOD96766.1 TonB family C-terminal domain-containing protein [Spirosoma fluviale]